MGDLGNSLKEDAEVPSNTLPEALPWLANLYLTHQYEADVFGNAFILQNTRSMFVCPQAFSIMGKFFCSLPHEKMNFLF